MKIIWGVLNSYMDIIEFENIRKTPQGPTKGLWERTHHVNQNYQKNSLAYEGLPTPRKWSDSPSMVA